VIVIIRRDFLKGIRVRAALASPDCFTDGGQRLTIVLRPTATE
jgi:hypothetical protein